MNSDVLSVVIHPLVAVVGTIFTAMVAYYLPKFLAAFENRTGIELTEAQRQTVIGAVTTAAGVLETALDRGDLKTLDIAAAHPAVKTQAAQVLDAVPKAAAAFGLTVPDVARLIVSRVDTARHVPPFVLPAEVPVLVKP
jgi:hypothetical protein